MTIIIVLFNHPVLVICNFSDKEHTGYEIGVPAKGEYTEIFNSDDEAFGGFSKKEERTIRSEAKMCHGRKNSLKITLAPLSVVYLQKVR